MANKFSTPKKEKKKPKKKGFVPANGQQTAKSAMYFNQMSGAGSNTLNSGY